MKKSKAAIASLLAASMLFSFGGCGKKETTADNGEAPTIRIFIEDRAEAPINTDMPVIQELMKKANVKIEFELAPSSDSSERFNLVMADSDNLPDVIVYKPDTLFKYTEAFEPLDELIKKDVPNLQKLIDDDKEIRKFITGIDGSIYVLPMLSAEKVSQVYFARQDWIDKLGIKQPESTDDFYNMLKAIKTGDPNGNGKADEVPFVTRSGKSGLMPIVEAFGIKEEFFVDNNKIAYGATDPRMKDALTYLNKLYSEGLIDQEYLTVDLKQWQAKITNETAGVTFDWLSRIDQFNTTMQSINKNALFKAIIPPAADGVKPGISYQLTKVRDNGAAAISKSSKNKDAIMRLFNYIYSDEGTMLVNFGIKDKHYYLDSDGIPHHNDDILNDSENSAQTILWSYGINLDWPCKQDKNHERQFVSDIANEARELYDPYIKEAFPKLRFTEEEQSQLDALMGDIKTYKDESMNAFITGAKNISEFDAVAGQLKKMGMDKVLDIYNKAYKRYNKK